MYDPGQLWRTTACAIFLCGSGLTLGWPADPVSVSLEKDREDLVAWLTGEFVARDPSSFIDKVSSETATIEGMAAPSLMVRELHGDPYGEHTRRRILSDATVKTLDTDKVDVHAATNQPWTVDYVGGGVRTFEVDPQTQSILMHSFWPSAARVRGVTQPEQGEPLYFQKDAIDPIEGCGVRFRREGMSFIGQPESETCRRFTDDSSYVVDREWRVTPERIVIYSVRRSKVDPRSTTPVRSEVFKTTYFFVRFVDQRQLDFLSGLGSPFRIADQAGTATFGPLHVKGEIDPDLYGTGAPELHVSLNRVGDRRTVRLARWWSDGRNDVACEATFPLDQDELSFEFMGARVEIQRCLAQTHDDEGGASSSLQFQEVKDWLTGTFSNAMRDQSVAGLIEAYIVPITPRDKSWPWFYVELRWPKSPEEKPIVQWLASPRYRGSQWAYQLVLFDLQEPAVFEGGWAKPRMFDDSRLRDVLGSSCTVDLHRRAGGWVGTSSAPCFSNPAQVVSLRLEGDGIVMSRRTAQVTGHTVYPQGLVRLDRIRTGDSE